ncbi:deoxyribodipyrimidine photolyase domain protein [Burkholderia pseudomallei MSHR2451]|nr:deoxyribodipyrimidine photolyase domain protein [Burkholderia pseudomallei MSHR2451]
MKGCQLVILRFLLTKADFFVDGKDLQTFVSATLRSRFFLVHRRKPWRLGERLRNLTPDFMDVRRRNCSIARHFRH